MKKMMFYKDDNNEVLGLLKCGVVSRCGKSKYLLETQDNNLVKKLIAKGAISQFNYSDNSYSDDLRISYIIIDTQLLQELIKFYGFIRRPNQNGALLSRITSLFGYREFNVTTKTKLGMPYTKLNLAYINLAPRWGLSSQT